MSAAICVAASPRRWASAACCVVCVGILACSSDDTQARAGDAGTADGSATGGTAGVGGGGGAGGSGGSAGGSGGSGGGSGGSAGGASGSGGGAGSGAAAGAAGGGGVDAGAGGTGGVSGGTGGTGATGGTGGFGGTGGTGATGGTGGSGGSGGTAGCKSVSLNVHPGFAKYVGAYSSVGVTSAGEIVVSYRDHTNQTLAVGSKLPTASFSTQPVDTNAGTNTSLAVGASSDVHVSYNASANSIKYARRSSGTWSVEPVATGNRGSIGVDASGKVHLAYTFFSTGNAEFRYTAKPAAGTWSAPVTIAVATTKLARQIEIAVQSDGSVHAIFSDDAITRYAKKPPAGNFVVEAFSSAATRPDIAVDKSGGVHVVTGGSSIHYSYRAAASATWTEDTSLKASQLAKSRPSIAIDGLGRVQILYDASGAGDLWLARKAGSNPFSTQDVAQYYTNAADASLAVDATGYAYVGNIDEYTAGANTYANLRVDVVCP